MFTDFLPKLTFYMQPEKFPVVWIRFTTQTNVTRLKRKKIVSELAAKHRQTAEMKLKLAMIVFLHET